MTMKGTKSVSEFRSLAHRAVTEGVNLAYVEQMRQALYAAADEIERLTGEAEFTERQRTYEVWFRLPEQDFRLYSHRHHDYGAAVAACDGMLSQYPDTPWKIVCVRESAQEVARG